MGIHEKKQIKWIGKLLLVMLLVGILGNVQLVRASEEKDKVEIEKEYYVVIFKDYNDVILKEEVVKEGENASAPDIPVHDSGTFLKWNKPFNNILDNTVITAMYSPYPSDYKNGENEHVIVEEENKSTDSEYFIEHQAEINEKIRAAKLKDKRFHVEYRDWDGKTLYEENVLYGEDSEVPPDPSRDGYNFIGWDRQGKNVKEDAVITAEYIKIPVSTKTVATKENENTLKENEQTQETFEVSKEEDETPVFTYGDGKTKNRFFQGDLAEWYKNPFYMLMLAIVVLCILGLLILPPYLRYMHWKKIREQSRKI